MTRIDSRYGPAALAAVAFVLTFAAVLFYGVADRGDPAAERAAEAIEQEVAETRTTTEDLAQAVVRFGLEVAAAREDAAAARDEAAAAYAEMAALAGRLVAAEHENARLAARQEVLEAALSTLQRRPPEVTVLVPEPEVMVETAEPEVTVEPPGGGTGTAGARLQVERAEPRVTVERPRPTGRRAQEARAAAPGDLLGADVVDAGGAMLARVVDVVRARDGAVHLVLDVRTGDAAPRRVALAREAFEVGPGGELILPPAAARRLAAAPVYREGDFEPLSP